MGTSENATRSMVVAPPRPPVIASPFARSLEQVEAAGGYQIVYADPAWQYKNNGRGAASKHYGTTADATLAKIPVSRMAARDSVLFMWGTWPTLKVNIATLEAWGFEYKTLGFLWVKTNVKAGTPFWGGGFWTRSNSEFCLIGVRGDIRRVNAGVHQLIETWDDQEDLVLRAPVGKHSAKPAEVRDRILKLMGKLSAIELFARERFENFDAWGNQVPGGSDVIFEEEKSTLDSDKIVDAYGVTMTKESSADRPVVIGKSASESEDTSASEIESEVQTEAHQGDEEDMANLPNDMAESVGKARVTGGGSYIQHGNYMLLIKKWFYQKIQDRCVITEFLVIESQKKSVYEGTKEVVQEPNAVGSDCSESINFDGLGKLSAEGNARAVVLALFGLKDSEVPDAIAKKTLKQVCKDAEDPNDPDLVGIAINPAAGMLIRLETYPKEVRSNKGTYITGRNWIGVNRPNEGINSAELVRQRNAAMATSAEECVRVTAAQLAAARGAAPGTVPASMPAAPVASPAAPVASPAAPVASPAASLPPMPAASLPPMPAAPPPMPPPPPPVVDPLAGWIPYPDHPGYVYRGSDVKTIAEVQAMAR